MGKRAAKAAAEQAGKVVEIVTRTTERRTGDEENLEIPVDPVEPGEDDVFDGLDDLGDSGARLEIRRTSPAEFAGYVGTYSREGWTPDRLMEEWGGGKFTIRVKNAAGQFMGVRHLTLAGKSKNKEAAPVAAPVAAAPAASSDSHLAQVLTAINESNKAAQEANKGQISLLTTLVTTLINKEAPRPPPAPDPLAMLEKAANILKPRDSGDAMAAFIKGLDMGKSLGDGGGEPGMGQVFMEGIKTIKEAAAVSASAQQQPRPAQRRIANPPPGSVPAQETPAAPPPNNPEKPPMTDGMKQIQWIRQQAKFLVLQASRNKSSELYAELFLDNLPDFLPIATVLEQMKDPGAVQKLGMLNADVLRFQPWFEDFRKAVVEFIEQPDEDDDDDATAAPAGTVIEGEVDTSGGGGDQ